MMCLLILSVLNIINFGIDGGNEITQIGIAIVSIISFPIFSIIKNTKKDTLLIKIIRSVAIILMISIIMFLLNDLRHHNQ